MIVNILHDHLHELSFQPSNRPSQNLSITSSSSPSRWEPEKKIEQFPVAGSVGRNAVHGHHWRQAPSEHTSTPQNDCRRPLRTFHEKCKKSRLWEGGTDGCESYCRGGTDWGQAYQLVDVSEIGMDTTATMWIGKKKKHPKTARLEKGVPNPLKKS